MVRWTAAFLPLFQPQWNWNIDPENIIQRIYQMAKQKQKIKSSRLHNHYNLFLQQLFSWMVKLIHSRRLSPSATSEHDHILLSQPSLPREDCLPGPFTETCWPLDPFYGVSECPVIYQQHFKTQSLLGNSTAFQIRHTYFRFQETLCEQAGTYANSAISCSPISPAIQLVFG